MVSSQGVDVVRTCIGRRTFVSILLPLDRDTILCWLSEVNPTCLQGLGVAHEVH